MNIVNIVKRLASLGHTVVGIELVETAIEEFFAENNIKFNVKTVDDFKVFSVKFIELVDIYGILNLVTFFLVMFLI